MRVVKSRLIIAVSGRDLIQIHGRADFPSGDYLHLISFGSDPKIARLRSYCGRGFCKPPGRAGPRSTVWLCEAALWSYRSRTPSSGDTAECLECSGLLTGPVFRFCSYFLPANVQTSCWDEQMNKLPHCPSLDVGGFSFHRRYQNKKP